MYDICAKSISRSDSFILATYLKYINPLNTRSKLSVHKIVIRRPGRPWTVFVYVQFRFCIQGECFVLGSVRLSVTSKVSSKWADRSAPHSLSFSRESCSSKPYPTHFSHSPHSFNCPFLCLIHTGKENFIFKAKTKIRQLPPQTPSSNSISLCGIKVFKPTSTLTKSEAATRGVL